MNKAARVADVPRPRQEWTARRERGSTLLLKAMAFVSMRFGRRISRFFLYCIAVYFYLFGPAARASALPYLRRVLGREPGPMDRFRQMLYFSTTIHDRVFLINRRFEVFDITVEGEQAVAELQQAGRGALLLGAHFGSFEIIHSLGRRTSLDVAMAMYEDNARKINHILSIINPQAQTQIVALGQLDAMLNIARRLEQGQLVGVLADRTLGDEPVQEVNFLGERAGLPVGAMRAAAILRCPVFFMAGLYRGGNRYHVVFDRVADFSSVGVGERKAAITVAIERYAGLLERHCRNDPYNWFNFYDFWRSHAQS